MIGGGADGASLERAVPEWLLGGGGLSTRTQRGEAAMLLGPAGRPPQVAGTARAKAGRQVHAERVWVATGHFGENTAGTPFYFKGRGAS